MRTEVAMKIFKQALIGFLICFLSIVAEDIIFWDDTYSTALKTLFRGVMLGGYYFVIGFPIYLLTITYLKSPVALALASLAIIVYFHYSGVVAAQDINLSSKVGGHDLYISGEITTAGFIFSVANPISILFVYAVYLIIRKHLIHKG